MADEITNPIIKLDEIERLFEGYVRPYVEISLLREMIEFKEKKPSKKEVRETKKSIDKMISTECPRISKKTKAELKAGLYGIVNGEIDMPDEEEITHYSQMTGRVMASGWVQYLALTLEKEKELPLNEQMLPKDTTTIDSDLQEAYDRNLVQLVIRKEDVPNIMERLAQTLFKDRNYINLVLGISIEKVQDSYVAKRI